MDLPGRRIVTEIVGLRAGDLEAKPCVQTFTFGQHNHHDLGNNHRPLLRLRWHDAPLYPDAIRVPSWRQENGDKRADPRGRVPGDVFDFTRVTGNSKQRRHLAPHPTQRGPGRAVHQADHRPKAVRSWTLSAARARRYVCVSAMAIGLAH